MLGFFVMCRVWTNHFSESVCPVQSSLIYVTLESLIDFSALFRTEPSSLLYVKFDSFYCISTSWAVFFLVFNIKLGLLYSESVFSRMVFFLLYWKFGLILVHHFLLNCPLSCNIRKFESIQWTVHLHTPCKWKDSQKRFTNVLSIGAFRALFFS